MPELTMASAICRIISSLTLHPNLFQLFHPIGGVLANPLSCADSEGAIRTPTRAARTLALTDTDMNKCPSLLFLERICSVNLHSLAAYSASFFCGWKRLCTLQNPDHNRRSIVLPQAWVRSISSSGA